MLKNKSGGNAVKRVDLKLIIDYNIYVASAYIQYTDANLPGRTMIRHIRGRTAFVIVWPVQAVINFTHRETGGRNSYEMPILRC